MVRQRSYAAAVKCRDCNRWDTRSSTGRCVRCRGLVRDEVAVGQPSVDDLRDYYRAKMAFVRDLGLDPDRDAAGDVDAVLARERFPDLKRFLLLRGGHAEGVQGAGGEAGAGLLVVQGGGGAAGGGLVPGLHGAADTPVVAGHPGEHPGELRAGGGGGGGATAGDGAGETGGPTAGRAAEVVAGGAAAPEAPGERPPAQVRLTRWWRGLLAGMVLAVDAVTRRGEVTVVEVVVPDGTLFGRRVGVPINYTEMRL